MAKDSDRFNQEPKDVIYAKNMERYTFVQLGDEGRGYVVGSDDDPKLVALKLHSGIRNPLGRNDPKFGEFIGTGGLVAISPPRDTSRTSADSFRIVIRIPPTSEAIGLKNEAYDVARDKLIKLAHTLDITDLPVCIWRLEVDLNSGDTPTGDDAIPTMLGHISRFQITGEAIDIQCYTAGKLLDQAWGVPVLWTDYHQNELNPAITNEDGDIIAPEGRDGAFRFSNRTAAELGVEFP